MEKLVLPTSYEESRDALRTFVQKHPLIRRTDKDAPTPDFSCTLIGTSTQESAASLNKLAMLYESQGRYEEAEPFYKAQW